MEQCESPQAFFVLHSMGGGTGSGLGSYIVSEVLRDEFPELCRFSMAVYPSADDDVITSPYNAVLATRCLTDAADCVLPIENHALAEVCARASRRRTDAAPRHQQQQQQQQQQPPPLPPPPPRARARASQTCSSSSARYPPRRGTAAATADAVSKKKTAAPVQRAPVPPVTQCGFDEVNDVAAQLLSHLT